MNFTTDDLTIIADHREEASGIPKILSSDALFDIKISQLGCGDYLVFDLAIERKSSNDFIASLKDGRLFRQLLIMKRLYRKRCLVVEANPTILAREDSRIEPSLVKISAGLQVPIIWSSGPHHTATVIRRAALQLYKLTAPSPVIRVPERSESLEFQQSYVLVGLPGVGVIRAKALITKFGSLAGVFSASEQDLATTEGIGPKLAHQIKFLISKSNLQNT